MTKRTDATALLLVILCLAAFPACGQEETSGYPPPGDYAVQMAREGREYILFREYVSLGRLNQKVNALHELGYEVVSTAFYTQQSNWILITMRKMPEAAGR